MDPADPGNWSSGKRGVGQLLGSNRGVTPTALAAYRKVPIGSITAGDMANLTVDEAASIAMAAYYKAPGFDRLPWNRITASIVDMGWGSGTKQAIKLLQRMIGVTDDGVIGPATIAAYSTWLEARQAEDWARVRYDFYDQIIAVDPMKAKYRNGWRNRTDDYTPGTAWWKGWAA